MVKSLIICGSGSLPREDSDAEEPELNHHRHRRSIRSAGSSPPKPPSSSTSRRSKSHNHHNHHNKNPYATRGLDKFSALLTEIEEKKQMIYSKNNPDDIRFVQFDFSKGNNNCKPIVIKVKPEKNNHRAEINETHQPKKQSHDKSGAPDHFPVQKLKLQKLRKPNFHLPVVLILILIFLALFGRSVAILCTAIGWYAIPIIGKRNLNSTWGCNRNGGLVGHPRRS